MKKHTKIYFEAFYGGDTSVFPVCEITGARAVDIHHIHARGMGGSKDKDVPENLMAVTRTAHLYFGDKTEYIEWLTKVHQSFTKTGMPWLYTNPDCLILKDFLCST